LVETGVSCRTTDGVASFLYRLVALADLQQLARQHRAPCGRCAAQLESTGIRQNKLACESELSCSTCLVSKPRPWVWRTKTCQPLKRPIVAIYGKLASFFARVEKDGVGTIDFP